MSKDSKRQKAHEKKTKRRAFLRAQHLNKAKSDKEVADYNHWVKFHTDETEVEVAHVDKVEKKEYDPNTTPLDVGTTRMKLEGVDQQQASEISEEQLRKELGIG